MFPLTRPVRQGLATALLVLLTIVPTIFVAAHAWRINRPGHIRDLEIELGRQLGLQVTLEAVRYPRAGEVVYQGIVLRHEEPRGRGLTEIARAGVLHLVRGDRELTLHAEKLKLSAASPAGALAQAGTMLQRSGGLPFDRINLAAQGCELELGREGPGYAISDVAGEFVADRVNPTLRVAYGLADPGSATRCELLLSRDRAAEPIRTMLVLKTLEGLPLPGRVLDVFFESSAWLGPRARVDGTLEVTQSGTGGCEASFQGNLTEVDLSTLVGKRFPRHQLSGTARITLQTARWGERPGQGPGWREAKGELTAGQGTISLSLMEALAREMKFRLSPRVGRLDPRRTETEFRLLGMTFDMQPSGEIRLAGALGSEFSPDTVIASPTAPLVLAPRGSASVHGLIKTLFPIADSAPGVMVPLTSQSRVLLCLPLAPEIAAKSARTLDGN
ncbi:MAG TPA: hypothetical protein VJY33_15495 [Isosphaeraceae bacterium]|nr:hypothetical protein [Isosphaeraceae bacterium]